jgi:hypothetical protein
VAFPFRVLVDLMNAVVVNIADIILFILKDDMAWPGK